MHSAGQHLARSEKKKKKKRKNVQMRFVRTGVDEVEHVVEDAKRDVPDVNVHLFHLARIFLVHGCTHKAKASRAQM
jgi:3-oxoacyl-[acyl-carrier-protein] synthase III